MFLFTWFFLDTLFTSQARFFIFQNTRMVSKKADNFYKNMKYTDRNLT